MDITTIHAKIFLALTLIRLAFEIVIVIVTEDNKTDSIRAALKDPSHRRICGSGFGQIFGDTYDLDIVSQGLSGHLDPGLAHAGIREGLAFPG